jgi:hypothetical protein
MYNAQALNIDWQASSRTFECFRKISPDTISSETFDYFWNISSETISSETFNKL